MIPLLLIALNMTANTAGHVCFKLSSADQATSFVFWQVLGNTAAFIGVLAYTGLMRKMSLLMAFPLTQGLTAIGVQVVASQLFFHEHISPLAWTATVLIALGIIVMNSNPPKQPSPAEAEG